MHEKVIYFFFVDEKKVVDVQHFDRDFFEKKDVSPQASDGVGRKTTKYVLEGKVF